MPIAKTLPVPSLGVDANWWRIGEVRDVRQPESGFSGVVGNLFVQVGGYASQAAFDGGAAPLVTETYRIRYGAQIADPVPDRFRDAAVIRADEASLSDVEAALLGLAAFAGGELL